MGIILQKNKTTIQISKTQTMKRLISILVLAFTFFNVNASDYVVSGAGSTEVDGTYVEDEEYNGKLQYLLTDTDYYLRYNSDYDGWEIWDDDNGETYYYTDDSGDTPPSTGWEVGDEGGVQFQALDKLNLPYPIQQTFYMSPLITTDQ